MIYNLIATIGLLLLVEGMLPFVAPHLWRKFILQFSEQSDRILRITGLLSMVLGLIILMIARRYN